MGRRATFTTGQLVASAASLAAQGGPGAVTMQGVAAAVGAPSGSLYHRFGSRSHLLATVWRDALAQFQHDWWELARGEEDPGAVAAISVRWARRKRASARVLLLHSASDFVGPDCPKTLQREVADMNQQGAERLAVMAQRYLGQTDRLALERTVFALTAVPLAAIRRPLKSGKPIGEHLERLVYEAATSLMGASDDR